MAERFLLGTSGSGPSKQTGGNTNIKLSVDNLPQHTHSTNTTSHSHSLSNHKHVDGFGRADGYGYCHTPNGFAYSRNEWNTSGDAGGYFTVKYPYTSESSGEVSSASPITSIGSTGNGQALDITPNYYTVHMWLRTS